MKHGLAVALSIVAFGCAEHPRHTSLDETIPADLRNADGSVDRLVWLQRYWSGPEGQFDRSPAILAVHEHSPGICWPSYTCSAYTVIDGRPRLDVSVELGEGWWQTPEVFQDGPDTLALFCVEEGGSSTYRAYALIHLAPQGARRVDIVQPESSLSGLVQPGQHIDQGRGGIEHSHDAGSQNYGKVVFTFSIWNQGDSGNHPRGGHVNGTMKIERDAAGMPQRLLVDAWKLTKAE